MVMEMQHAIQVTWSLFCAGADLRDEPHMLEKELGRIRESYNSMGDSMYGVFAGIVDAEAKRNPSLKYDGSWWDTNKDFLISFEFQGNHAWPNSIDNVYDTCDDSSPHPYCKSTASSNWTENFRNLPLQQVVWSPTPPHHHTSSDYQHTPKYPPHRHAAGMSMSECILCPAPLPGLLWRSVC